MEFLLRFLMLFALFMTVISGANPHHDHISASEHVVGCDLCDTGLLHAPQTVHASCPDMIACSIAMLPVESVAPAANTMSATRPLAPLFLVYHGVLPELDLPPPRA